jgi:hypothetical protein
MDGKRFDALSRSVAVPATRRSALGSMVASGLLAAFGINLKQAPAAAQETQEATCVVDFAATVRQGPSAGQPAGDVRGELSFGLSGKGNLANASLRLADGTSVPVVGQATGHSLQIRLQLAANQALVAIGVGEREITECEGAIDGLVTGPAAGDLGDFHAVVIRSTGDLGAGGAGGNEGDGQKKDKDKDKKNAAQQGAASGGAASGGAASGGGGGGQNPDKKDKKNAGSGGANAGSTQAQGTDTGATGSDTAATPCAAGLTRCGDACVDLAADLNNCGACGSVCESGLVPVECRGGVCERANCPEGVTFCGAVDGCRDLATDAAHCGACGNACATGESCVSGACQATQPQTGTCEQGLTDCSGTCVNTATDPANCGSCGFACPAGNECSDGACIAPVAPPADNCVPQGLTACAGFCVDLNVDAAHCGACGAACAAGESCAGGICQAAAAAQAVTCAAGETDCSGVCVDLTSDFGNCGACGVVCVAPQGCSGGQCVDQTAPPPTNCAAIGPTFIDCGGVCVDPQTDPINCGGCGVTCQNQCAGGVCA